MNGCFFFFLLVFLLLLNLTDVYINIFVAGVELI